MPIETASLFFVDDAPRASLGALLRALAAHKLLADEQVDADGEALAAHATFAPLFATGHASLEAFLAALVSIAPDGASQARAFFYVRLAAPSALPPAWRAALADKLGDMPEAPDELVHIHPYELVLTVALDDPDHAKLAAQLSTKRHRAHPHLPGALRMVDDHGEPITARAGFELRCPPDAVGVLAFVLEKAGLLAGRLVLVRVLD
jgi:hypothetical protein